MPRLASALAGDERSRLAALQCVERTGAALYGLAQHALSAPAPAEGLLGFVNRIGGELRSQAAEYESLGAAMAAEACVAAASGALAAAAGAAHRNPYHEILAGG